MNALVSTRNAPSSAARALSGPTAMDVDEEVDAAGAAALDAERLSSAASLAIVMDTVKQSVYAICYARGLFPEAHFVFSPGALALRDGGSRDLPGRSVDSARVRTLNGWLDDGLRESIAKKYCRAAALVILDDADDALEVYTFKFAYPSSSGVVVDGRELTVGDMRRQITQVKNELHFFATMLPVLAPTAASVAIKLTFTSSAPAGYVPTGFAVCSRADLTFGAATAQTTIRLALGKAKGIHALELVYRGPPPPIAESDERASSEVASGERDYSLLATHSGKTDEKPYDSAPVTQDSYDSGRVPRRGRYPSAGVPVCSQDSNVSSQSSYY